MSNEIANRMHAGLTCSLYQLTDPVLQQAWGVNVASFQRRLDLSATGSIYSIRLTRPLGGKTDAAGLLVESEGVLTWASIGGTSCQIATDDVPLNIGSDVLLGPYPPSTALAFTQILIMSAEEGEDLINVDVPLVNVLLTRTPGD